MMILDVRKSIRFRTTGESMISINKTRTYVHTHGTMWERALFEYLFFDGPLERVHQCLRCYKNADGGWGHGMEHDIRCPSSNPLALEFLLSVFRDTGIEPGDLLDGAAAWVETNQADDGTLINPPDLLDWPHKPWWNEGGQTAPDSIVGNLIRFGKSAAQIEARTQQWVSKNLTIEKIQSNEWLFMAYHAYDYFTNVTGFPDLEAHRAATIENIERTTQSHRNKGEFNKLFPLFQFAPTPSTPVAKNTHDDLISFVLDHLESTQRDDGAWDDEHGLAHWQPYFSTIVLLA